MSDLHQKLLRVVKHLPTDYRPYGKRDRTDGVGDCSCGCKHYAKLEGGLQFDWGVCVNPRSPRFGLLTFEHQGCPKFESEKRRKLKGCFVVVEPGRVRITRWIKPAWAKWQVAIRISKSRRRKSYEIFLPFSFIRSFCCLIFSDREFCKGNPLGRMAFSTGKSFVIPGQKNQVAQSKISTKSEIWIFNRRGILFIRAIFFLTILTLLSSCPACRGAVSAW